MHEFKADRNALLRELEEVRDAYRADAKQFVDFVRDRGFSLPEALRAYAEWLGAEHGGKRYSPATVNRKISAAKHRIRYAFKHGSFADSLRSAYQLEEILGEVKLQRVDPAPAAGKRCVDLDEVKLLAKETRDKTIGLMVRFLAGTGVRISEMLSVRISDLRPESGNLIPIRVLGKYGRERYVHANADLVKHIFMHFKGNEYLFEHGRRKFSRVSVTNRIKHESLRILGLEVSAQQLRYAWAREQIRRGKSVRAVAAVLGCADPGHAAKLLTDDRLAPQDEFLDVGVSSPADGHERHAHGGSSGVQR